MADRQPLLRALLSGRERTRWRRHLLDVIIPGNGLLLLHFALSLLPIEACSAIGYWAGRLYGPRSRVRDQRARHNLRRLRPDLATPEALEGTMRRYWGNAGRAMAEFSVLRRLWRARRMSVVGMEHLLAAGATGRPRIYLLSHLGNWELVGPKLIDLGEPGSQIAQRLQNPYRDRIATAVRSPYADKLIMSGPNAGRETFKRLRDARGLALAGDEFHGGALWAPSFGRPMQMSGNLGRIVRLVKLTNALVLPAYCIRLKGATFRMHILSPIDLDLTSEDYLQRGVERLDAALTPIIVAHLDQWLMLDNFRLD